jgi:hypothetical protein
MRLLELFELQQQEGPCLDAFRTGERVGHENLDAGSGRWPSFSAAALRAGFQSASAVPLRLRDVTLGALNLLSVTRAPMEEADVIVARAFADLATLSIVQHRASAEAQRLNEQLSAALTSRVVIEQAKGVISERAGVDLAEAFSRLRAYARNHNFRLTDVARGAIDGTLDPLAWAAYNDHAVRWWTTCTWNRPRLHARVHPTTRARSAPPDGGAGHAPVRVVSGVRESGHGRGSAGHKVSERGRIPRRSSRSTRPRPNSAPGPRGWVNAGGPVQARCGARPARRDRQQRSQPGAQSAGQRRIASPRRAAG